MRECNKSVREQEWLWREGDAGLMDWGNKEERECQVRGIVLSRPPLTSFTLPLLEG